MAIPQVTLTVCAAKLANHRSWVLSLQSGSRRKVIEHYSQEDLKLGNIYLKGILEGLETLQCPCWVSIDLNFSTLRQFVEKDPKTKLWQDIKRAAATHEIQWNWMEQPNSEFHKPEKHCLTILKNKAFQYHQSIRKELIYLQIFGNTFNHSKNFNVLGLQFDRSEKKWKGSLTSEEIQWCRELANRYDLGYVIYTDPKESRLPYQGKPIDINMSGPSVMGQGSLSWWVGEGLNMNRKRQPKKH